MRNSVFFVVLVLAAGSLSGCRTGEAAGAVPDEPAISATSAVAKRAPFVARYEAVGTVASKTTSPIASRILGQVTAVHVREGDHIHGGQVLVEIEARDVAATVARAKAGLAEAEQSVVEVDRSVEAAEQARIAALASRDLAKVTYDRYAALVEARAVSRQQ